MLESAETLRALGIESLMPELAAKQLLDAAPHGIKARFGNVLPNDYHRPDSGEGRVKGDVGRPETDFRLIASL